MSNLINPKPRFGYNPDLKSVYDYVLQRDVPVVTDYVASDGVWDLTKVRDAIIAGQQIESARKSVTSGPLKVSGAQPAPAAKAPAPAAKSGAITASTTTPAAMKALAFTPTQAAALGISQAELTGGMSAAQVSAIKAKLTPARAIALKLTAAQKSFLGV
jgi:hypothetical protein